MSWRAGLESKVCQVRNENSSCRIRITSGTCRRMFSQASDMVRSVSGETVPDEWGKGWEWGLGEVGDGAIQARGADCPCRRRRGPEDSRQLDQSSDAPLWSLQPHNAKLFIEKKKGYTECMLCTDDPPKPAQRENQTQAHIA